MLGLELSYKNIFVIYFKVIKDKRALQKWNSISSINLRYLYILESVQKIILQMLPNGKSQRKIITTPLFPFPSLKILASPLHHVYESSLKILCIDTHKSRYLTASQMLTCEFYEIYHNSFFCRTYVNGSAWCYLLQEILWDIVWFN